MVRQQGFQPTEKLADLPYGQVVRGQLVQMGTPVVVKRCTEANPGQGILSRLENERTILRRLQGQGVPNLVEHPAFDSRLDLAVEDIGGWDLPRVVVNYSLSMKERFEVAIKLAEALTQLHAKNILHLNLRPEHVIWNPNSGDLKLVGLGRAVFSSNGETRVVRVDTPTDLLGYLSPEQTGRMNRPVDARSDLYGVGALYFFIFIGRAPFVDSDPVALVHSILAKLPPKLGDIDPEMPKGLDDILEKLLAKNPDDRYQNAQLLMQDLQRLVQHLDRGLLDTRFALTSHDFRSRLRRVRAQYGRESLRFAIESACQRVENGRSEILFVIGPSGIGKSTAIHEALSLLRQNRFYFGFSKLEQLRPDAADERLFKAINSILIQILAEKEDDLLAWREKFLAAVGSSGRVLTEIFPDLEAIIGAQPAMAYLPEAEAAQRFQRVLGAFFSVLSGGPKPVVIFVDDLQWADLSALRLVDNMMRSAFAGRILFVGAYRDKEVHVSHPLMTTLKAFEDLRIPVRTETVGPLTLGDVRALLKDLFAKEGVSAEGDYDRFADLCVRKTHGNPFFLKQMLSHFVSEGLVWFAATKSQWTFDEHRIESFQVAENVVDFMVAKLRVLDPLLLELLQHAAVLGREFEDVTLAHVMGLSTNVVQSMLHLAVEAELIVRPSHGRATDTTSIYSKGQGFVFIHDRVQQALYDMTEEPERSRIHLRIGRKLLQGLTDKSPDDYVSSVLTHFQQVTSKSLDLSERREIAQLAVRGVARAKSSGAFERVYGYCTFGLDLLEEEGWQRDHGLTFVLYEEMGIAAYLIGRSEELDQAVSVLTEYALTPQALARINEAKIKSLTDQRLYMEALIFGLSCARKLGVDIAPHTALVKVAIQVVRARLAWLGKDIGAIESLAPCEDPKIKALHRVLGATITAAYFIDTRIAVSINLKIVELSLRYGNDAFSPQAYAQYGIVLAGYSRRFRDGLSFGEMALRLASKPLFQESLYRTQFYFYGLVRHWMAPLEESIAPMQKASRMMIMEGNYQDGHLCGALALAYKFVVGVPLPQLAREIEPSLKLAEEHQQVPAVNVLKMHLQTCINFMGQAPGSGVEMRGPVLDSRETLGEFLRQKDYIGFCGVIILESIICLIQDEPLRANHFLFGATRYARSLTGLAAVAGYRFFSAMAALSAMDYVSGIERARLLRRAKSFVRHIRKEANAAPANRGHYYYLVMAELARVEDRPLDTVRYYLKAIDIAQQYSVIHIVAYAAERYAKYLLSLGDTVSARVYLLKARKAYEDWGAALKVHHLNQNYSSLLADDLMGQGKSSERNLQLSAATLDGAVDTKTMVRASQSLSSKMILDDLIEDLMRVTMENAGATHGFMAIIQGEKLLIRVEAVAKERIHVVRMEETAAESFRVPQRVIQYVINTKRALVLDDAVDEGVFAGDPYIAYSRAKSLLCQPILHQGELIGILCLENHLIARAFTQDRVELLGILAAQAAISMKNTQYVSQVADKVRLESQVIAAQAVHLTLLPKNPAPPEVSIAMHYHSADQIGGDWVTYDFDPLAGRIFLCVGDVTGHGIPSALVTAAAAGAFKATVMSFASENFHNDALEKHSMESMDRALLRLATAVNKTVHQTGSQVKRDMTMAFVAVDLRTGNGAYINAAHLPILHLSQDSIATLTATSSMLGLDQDAKFFVKRFRMSLGDRLFIFTDGLTENRGPTGQKLKLIQVRNILMGCPDPSYAAETLLEQARFIWRAEKPKDDCSFLIMRWDRSLSDGDENQDGLQPTDLSA